MARAEPEWLTRLRPTLEPRLRERLNDRDLSPAERARVLEGLDRLRVEPGAPPRAAAGAPAKPRERAQKRPDRSGVIARAKAAERDYLDALTAGPAAAYTSGRIAAPPPKHRTAARVGLGYVRGGASDYDWFDGLSKAEQSRYRQNWMTTAPGAPTPDEIESAGMSMTEWVALTRGVDAARALQKRSGLSKARYGNRDPLRFLDVGRPEDHGTPTTRVRKSTGDHGYMDAYGSSRVRFFTDKEGVVHPIRASYERPKTAAEKERAREQARRDEYEEPF